VSAPDVRTPAWLPADSDTKTQSNSIVSPARTDVNDAERIAMLATIEAVEWFSLGRRHRICRPAGVGALRWSRDKIPHRLVIVGNGYVTVVTESGVPIGSSLRRNATRAPKLWIPVNMVAWDCLLPGNRLYGSIDELLDRRRSDPRKMFSLRAYLVFNRCGAIQPILARSTRHRLERDIRQTAGGRNPYAAESWPEWLSPAYGRAAP